MSTAAPSCSFITAAPYTPIQKDTLAPLPPWDGAVEWHGDKKPAAAKAEVEPHEWDSAGQHPPHPAPVRTDQLSATHTHYRAPHTRPIRHTTTTMPTLCRRRSCHVVIPRVPLGRLHLASEWSEPVLPAPTTGTVLVHVPTVQLVRWSILAWRDVRQNQ